MTLRVGIGYFKALPTLITHQYGSQLMQLEWIKTEQKGIEELIANHETFKKCKCYKDTAETSQW